MSNKAKMPVCSNHLPDLFGALQAGNIKKIREIEHELAPEEKCVVCTYSLRLRG